MRAEGAFLGDVHVAVEVNHPVGAGIHAIPPTGALFRIDDDDAVFPLVDCLGLAGLDAGSVVALLADVVHVTDAYLGHRSLRMVGYLFQKWPMSGCGLA